MVRRIIAYGLILVLLNVAMAPLQSALAQDGSNTSGKTVGPRKQIATIIFSGLAGAVLGLSTLSFYGRPQDKLSNIAVGFAVGIIIGATYTTYKAATQPRDFYNNSMPNESWNIQTEPITLADGHLSANSWQESMPSTTVIHSPVLGSSWAWSF